MRVSEEQIFKAGVVHGYLMAQQGTLFAEMGDSEVTRRIVESHVWEAFSRSHPKEAAEYQEFLSNWKPKRNKSHS